ncbi:MAG TPA: DUF4834 family protein [Flavisolibacter sp.]|nr:DUF4834 family protein [Flavisolibacter sp.]
MILSFLFYVFVFYVGYKLLFDFIIPIFRTTRQVRRGFKQMHQQMNEQMHQQSGSYHTQTHPGYKQDRVRQTPNTDQVGEYIDFEDVK